MNRVNTKLPKVPVPQPPKIDWFSRHHLWGYAFLILAFLLAVGFIYQVQYGRRPTENQICIQVVTSARNTQTGEIKEFPTPCDVPEGWEEYSYPSGRNVPAEPGDNGIPNTIEMCAQVVIPARHKQTGEVREFPTPCHVPDEWEAL